MPVDDDTLKFLDEVKKGKPRKFAMICKGTKILNLIVYKKGSEEKHKKLLKKADGSGQFFGGVVTGKGKNIAFELLRDDYDRAPGKDLHLKQFLDSEAGLQFKPTYVIVDTLSNVNEADDDDEQLVGSDALDAPLPTSDSEDSNVSDVTDSDSGTVDPQPKSVEKKSVRSPAATSSNLASDEKQAKKDARVAEQLMQALDEQRPLVDQVIAKNSSAEDDMLDKMSDIVDQIRAKQFTEARENIGALGHALSYLLKSDDEKHQS